MIYIYTCNYICTCTHHLILRVYDIYIFIIYIYCIFIGTTPTLIGV